MPDARLPTSDFRLPTSNSKHKKTRTRRVFFERFGLLLLESTETLVEAVDTATGINNFLLTSVERVASGAHVQVDSAWLSGFGLDYVAAGAGCFQLSVFWMNTLFHGVTSWSSRRCLRDIRRYRATGLTKNRETQCIPHPCMGNKDAHNTRADPRSKSFHVLFCC